MKSYLFLILYALANLRENKVLANNKCFTVVVHINLVIAFFFAGNPMIDY